MEYVSVRVSTLRGDLKIDFDVFVKINDKHILYIRKGDSFEGVRLKRLKEKKLKKMFILPDAEPSYREYIKKNIEMAYDMSSNKSLETRSEIIQGQQQSNTEQVFENPEDAEVYGETKKSAGQYVDFLLKNSDAVKAILNIENSDKSIAHHGVSVSTLSVALAQKLGVEQKNMNILALGSLLHDIGHHDTTVNLHQPLKMMQDAELSLYKQHPVLGAQRVVDKKHFDPGVIKIINEHEEHIDGSGFPRAFYEKDLDPLSVIVASANAIDRLITFEEKPKAEAAKALTIERIGQHPLRHIQILGDILKTLQ